MCNDNGTKTKGWPPFGPPKEFEVADAIGVVSWVIAMRGSSGRWLGGRIEVKVRTLLIVELGSLFFF